LSKRRFELLPKRLAGDPRASAVAFALQLLLILIIVPALVVPVAYDLLRDDAGRAVIAERVSWEVMLPTDGPAVREPARDGGDGREATEDPPTPTPTPPLVAPTGIPTGVPTPPAAAPAPVGGLGPLVGGGGATQGIRPSFTDQRLWVKHHEVVLAPIVPLTRADTLRLLLERRIYAMEDSLALLGPTRQPGDWTFDAAGKKYGIDGQMIRLGNFSLPTAVLGFLPLNVQANPIAMERARRLESMREEIQTQAARAMRDDEFYAAVRALRERKERERREAEATRPPPERP
jgi:hypothetical protein